LALDESALRAAADAAGSGKVLALLDAVRQVRKDGPLALTLRVSDAARRGVDGSTLQFDTPATCVAWWAALSRARLGALRARGWQSALYEAAPTEKPFLALARGGSDGARDERLPPGARAQRRGPGRQGRLPGPPQGDHPAAARHV